MEKHTICRACHAGCGVIVKFDNGRPVSVKGNPDNPLYKGFCCTKGQNLLAQRNSPHRLLHTRKRLSDGRYADIAIDQALDEIAERLQALIATDGPRAVATYMGTMASVASCVATPLLTAWMNAIGSPMMFSSNTIDQPGKMVASALFGQWQAPEDNFAISRVTMLVGTNPLVAMSGGIPHTNPGRMLTDALARGMKLVVIDPRRSDCARRATLHLQPRPGFDPQIIACLLRVIIKEGLYDRDFVNENLSGFNDLCMAIEPFTPQRVGQLADLPPQQLIDAARLFAGNGPGVATAGTGPNMSGHTTLLEYLLLCLNSICGRWQRAGETVIEPSCLGFPMHPKAQAVSPTKQSAYGFGEKLRVRGLANTAAGLPTAALAEEILMPGDGQVKALISHGGNPVVAWPDQIRTVAALEQIPLLVQIDTTMSATAQLADYVIAVRQPLEMAGISLPQEYMSSYAPGFGTVAPFAQYTPAILPPPEGSDLIEDWQFYYGLAQRMGLPLSVAPLPWSGSYEVTSHTLDMHNAPGTDDLFEMITSGSRIPLSEVRKYPAGALFPNPPVIVAAREPGWRGRLDAGDPDMMADLANLPMEDKKDPALPWRLVSRRQINVYNSTGIDIPGQVRNTPYNPAFMHPDDLAELGLHAGDSVVIRTHHAKITGIVQADDHLRRGLVSMAHAWGNREELDAGYRTIGSCTGRLSDVTTGYERYTGLPRMSNIPVSIEPLST